MILKNIKKKLSGCIDMMKYLLFIIVVLAGALTISVKSCQEVRKDRGRLSDNQRALMSEIDFYRTNDSLSVASVERLTLSNREFTRYCCKLEETVSNLNLKIKRLQSVSQTATETEYQVKTEIRDSIVVLPGRIDTLPCIDYRNNYLTLSGCFKNKEFDGIIQTRDTIEQIVHRVPRKLWFIRWGTKAIRQEVISKNPYSRITYTEYIELKR